VVRYVARHGGNDRVSRAVLIGAVPGDGPVGAQSRWRPAGVFDGFPAVLVADRAQFYRDVPADPFYGFNRAGVQISPGVVDNWWREGMAGGAKPHYDCIKAFSEADFTEDLRRIEVPVLVMHGEDDQIVLIANSAPLSAKLPRNATLKTNKDQSHGMANTHADVIDADLLAFIRG
jgi:non-heme chloroperoxidase